MTWTIIDLILILLLVSHLANGWRRGFLWSVLDLAAWIGSLILAFRFYQPVAGWLGDTFGWSDVWTPPLAFIAVAMFANGLIHLAGSLLFKPIPQRVHKHGANRALGIVPGAISGLIVIAIVASLLLALPLSGGLRDAARNSTAVNRLAASTEQVEAALTPIFGAAIERTLNLITIQPQSDERIALPFTIADARPRPDLEAQMLELINRERAAEGLDPLAADPELTPVARAHSADMFARGYFAHNTPEGATPFDRMRAAGVSFRVAGENLALAPTLTLAHNGLMNSPGHRANILRPEFGRVGIGILDGGDRGLMVTQNFRD